VPLLDDDGSWIRPTPPPPPPPATPPPAPPAPAPSPAPAPAPTSGLNVNGETLAQAEAAVLAEVAAGALGADALARHPLPPGTSTAEALRFLASIPQTTYVLGTPGGTVTGPPIGGDGQPPGGLVDPSEGDPAGDPGPIPTDDDYQRWDDDAIGGLLGDRSLQAVTHPAPGTIIGRPYEGTHGRDFNKAGGSDNWQSENAVDVWLPTGTPIVAPDSGTISPAGWGYGKSAQGGRFAGYRFHLVTHSAPFVYFGTHLRSLVAQPGEKVSKGQLIGYSGIANGVPHLHFAVPPGYDPADYVRDAYSLSGIDTNIRNPQPAEPPATSSKSLDHAQSDVEDAYNQLGRVLAYTLPDATVNIRKARQSLGDAVS
jgi:murein DD-endopeptidase MepM/ murein hydrolase activator NlpD